MRNRQHVSRSGTTHSTLAVYCGKKIKQIGNANCSGLLQLSRMALHDWSHVCKICDFGSAPLMS